jgi:hypothetical protein
VLLDAVHQGGTRSMQHQALRCFHQVEEGSLQGWLLLLLLLLLL